MENLEQEIGVGAGIKNTRFASVWQTVSLTLWDKERASPEGSPGTGRRPGCSPVPSVSYPMPAQGHPDSASAAHISSADTHLKCFFRCPISFCFPVVRVTSTYSIS